MKSIAAASLCAFVCLIPALAAESTPVATVKDVMARELLYLASSPDPLDDPFGEESLAQNFTPEFAAAYTAVIDRMEKLNEPLIDGDLILNAQDYCPPEELSLQEQSQEAYGEVVASFKTGWCFQDAGTDVTGKVTDTIFSMVNRDGRWLIDDIEVDGSTRALFEQLMKE